MTSNDIHNYFFPVKKPKIKNDRESMYEWVEVAPGKSRLVKKEGDK